MPAHPLSMYSRAREYIESLIASNQSFGEWILPQRGLSSLD
jgi:hypothetical protein